MIYDGVNSRGFGLLGRAGVAVLLHVLMIAGSLPAYDGVLDSSWSGDGISFLGGGGVNYSGHAIARQCDGKIVVAGSMRVGFGPNEAMVARYLSDGTLDASFATGGVFTRQMGDVGGFASDLAIQPDGKIVVVSQYGDSFTGWEAVVLRLTSAGMLDPTFSDDGIELYQFGTATYPRGLALQDDGRILIVGDTDTDSSMVIARILDDGPLDPTFNGIGYFLVDFTLGDDEGWDVTVQPDGRILAVGTATIPLGTVVAVVRLTSDGSYDTSFGPGGGGATPIDFGDFSAGRAIALQPDGKIAVTGFTDASTAIAVARLTADGILDSTFSSDGMTTFDLGQGTDEGWDIAIQGEDRIVVAGTGFTMSQQKVVMARFLTDGSLDPTYLEFGYGVYPFSGDSIARGLIIEPNTRTLMVAGEIETGSSNLVPGDSEMFVFRLVGDETLVFASNFECGGTAAWGQTAGAW